MTNTNVTNLRKNLFSFLDSAINYNDIINVNTKKGNAIIISEAEYNGLLETIYLLSAPEWKKESKRLKSQQMKNMRILNGRRVQYKDFKKSNQR